MKTTTAGPRSQGSQRWALLLALVGWLAIGCISSNEDSKSSAVDSVQKSDTALSIEYDRFENWTEVSTPWVAGSTVSVMADYTCSGKPSCTPSEIWLRMDLPDHLIPDDRFDDLRYRVPSGWTPEDVDDEDWYAAVIFLLDGDRRIRKGRATPDGYYANVQLSASLLSELTTADTVEFRMLNVEGALTEMQQTILERVLKLATESEE